ncbi:MAG: hypothetical protein OQL06_09360 [Gammaproteobacteria bacterium]|nr:hypothetical protein [Gammaproteobacteria bacterium]
MNVFHVNNRRLIHTPICTYQPHILYRVVFLLLFLLCCLVAQSAFADNKTILIISASNNTFTKSIAASIARTLDEHKFSYTEKYIAADTNPPDIDLDQHSLIIALNSKTTDFVLQHSKKAPVFSLLVSQQSYEILKQKYNRKNWSTLLLDQPYQRHLFLIDALFDKKHKIGTILGPYSLKQKNSLIDSASGNQQSLSIENIEITDQLISTLKDLINKTDVLLAVPDPVAFNKNTIRGILLLTYRKGIPVIGFSKSYVKAGAVAAIYSEAEQITRQTFNIISLFLKSDHFTQALYHPDDFSVATNNNVAHTLGIKLKPENKLKQLIKIKEDAK